MEQRDPHGTADSERETSGVKEDARNADSHKPARIARFSDYEPPGRDADSWSMRTVRGYLLTTSKRKTILATHQTHQGFRTMKSFIIRITDWVVYVAIAATVIYAYTMGAYHAGWDNNPFLGLLYALGGFCVASVVSGVWFCLSGLYRAVDSLETEAIRARLRVTAK